MSIWYEVKNKEDVSISEDGKTVEILFKSDNQGNYYVDVPIDFLEQEIENKKDQK